MMNSIVGGAYILVILYGFNGGGVTTHEFRTLQECQYVAEQLEEIPYLRGHCFAKDVKDD